MARLRKHLVKRGGVYYHRSMTAGRVRWVSLGTNEHTIALVRWEREERRLERNAAQKRAPATVSRETTVAAFSKLWVAEYVRQRRSPGNVKLAEQRLRDHVLPEIGKLYLPEITLPVVRRLRGTLDGRLSPQSVRHVLADVRCLLRYAMESGAVDTVPPVNRALPKVGERVRRLSDEQVAEILGQAPPAHALIIRFLLLTGLRWSEFVRLTWTQVRDLPVPHLELDRTKTGRVRRVPLGVEARAVLKQLKGARVGNRAGKPEDRTLLVSPIRSKNAAHMAQRMETGLGFRWSVHQLRHTFAARYLEAGGSVAALQEILGHRSPITTQRYSSGREALIFREAAGMELTSGFRSEVVAQSVAVESGAPHQVESTRSTN